MDENIDNIAQTFFFLLILCSFISDTHYVIKERNPKLDYIYDCIQALFIYSFTENKNKRLLIDTRSMEEVEYIQEEIKEDVKEDLKVKEEDVKEEDVKEGVKHIKHIQEDVKEDVKEEDVKEEDVKEEDVKNIIKEKIKSRKEKSKINENENIISTFVVSKERESNKESLKKIKKKKKDLSKSITKLEKNKI